MFFFFNDTATTEIYTLSLHDALPILRITSAIWPLTSRKSSEVTSFAVMRMTGRRAVASSARRRATSRSEEHTSELQSRQYLVCRLLLVKKLTRSTSSVVQTTADH